MHAHGTRTAHGIHARSCATGDALVALGENNAGPQLWILDAASLAVLHEQPAVGATSATKLAAVADQHIAVGGKNCLYILAWPSNLVG
jgi:hypothetical protein